MLQRDRQRQRERGTAGGGGAVALTAEYLVVAGGAGGASAYGGGGAGGYRTAADFSIALGSPYAVTVGAGGSGGAALATQYGVSGNASTFSDITSAGGGGGAAYQPNSTGLDGGSGGGAGYAAAGGVGGSGNVPATTPSQGNDGGTSSPSAPYYGGGGGGGAGAVGGNGTTTAGGAGGTGSSSSITGSAVTRAGGGGGGVYTSGTPGSGGLGGGGAAGASGVIGTSGTANTGGGGGAGHASSTYTGGGAGGSGVVIIKVPSEVVAEFSAGVVYNYIPTDDFNVYEITAAGVSDTVTFSQGAVTTVSESLRFNDDDSAYLTRTPASAGNRQKFTWSGWIKRATLGTSQFVFGANSGASVDGGFVITSSDTLGFSISGNLYNKYTSAVFRDPSAWYHVVIQFDTTQAAAENRIRIYVNGKEETDHTTQNSGLPPLNTSTNYLNTATNHTIGRLSGFNQDYFDGYLSDVYFIDGEALDPSRFGKQDADGIWQPISYAGSYGTNGFHLDFADNSTAAALGTDTSGNGNDWTPSGITTDDQVTDTPSVNYCTLNPVDPRTTGTLSNGNLVTTGNAAVTMRPSTGEYYYEKDGVGVSYDTSVSGPFDPVLPAGSYNFGQLPWADTGPTGAEVALNSANLPAPTITDGKAHFQPVVYTGNGTTQFIGGLEFSPDFVWVKERDSTEWHQLYDALRGTGALHSNETAAETAIGGVTLGTNGFTVSDAFRTNQSGSPYVAWTWNAGGSTVTNTDGTVSAQVRANTTAGFSIVSFSAVGTIGHGLNQAPEIIITKSRSNTLNWWTLTTLIDGSVDYLALNLTDAKGDDPDGLVINDSTFTQTIGYISSSTGVVAYCFHSVDGFSKFGTYTGNGSADGPFVYTGFRPAFVMLKSSSVGGSAGYDWIIHDTSRAPYNASDKQLIANSNVEENKDSGGSVVTDRSIDILSNGFKLRASSAGRNQSGQTFIFMAFAENPFKTARAR